MLFPCDKEEVLKGKWLNDRIIHSATLLAKQFPFIQGLQDPLKKDLGGFDMMSQQFVQVMHVMGNHWITVSNLASTMANEVCVYDSLYSSPSTECRDTTSRLCFPSKILIT